MADENGTVLTKGWALAIAVVLLTAVSTFLAKTTIAHGNEISGLQVEARAYLRELTSLRREIEIVRTDVGNLNAKIDRLLERRP